MDVLSALLWTAIQLAQLHKPRIAESITVVGRPSAIATPSATTTLGQHELQAVPALTLDDTLRAVPGFSLFRRSSSRVANPTTQGVTLRGLAASGASRALVLADGAPMNDPFGGWVSWSRVPAAAIGEVAVARGASGDEHGAEALAGVVSIRTSNRGGRLFLDAGSHSTGRISAFGAMEHGPLLYAGSAEAFTTDGYIVVAPESAGAVDEPAASRHASTYGALEWPAQALSLTASHFRESRRNGTPLQRNSTRATHLASSMWRERGENGLWSVRAHVSSHQYEQTFSAVFEGRAAERLTSGQLVGATSMEARGEYTWRHPRAGRHVSLDAGARRVAADMTETVFGASGVPLPPTFIDASHVSAGAAAKAGYQAARWSAGAALRMELWKTGDNSTVVLNPKLWITSSIISRTVVTASVQSGFRPPTLNELYRPFRVGGVITNANASLIPERARGVEAGVVTHLSKLTIRGLLFWSEVDDAIVNVTLSSNPDLVVRQRQNAARIRAAGTEIEVEARIARWLAVSASSAYTDSSFETGPLEGLRVPQVPRVQHAIGGRLAARRFRASAEWRYIGRQFDDDRNAFALDRSSMTDARVGWMFGRRVEVFGAIENLFDDEQDVGRTPLRTIGLPRTSRAGVRVTF